jgi:hypothetical protein
MTAMFSRPSFAIFTTLLAGWVLAPGRRTVTAMIGLGDPEGRRAHDAYHRFFRCGRWSMEALWKLLAIHAVGVVLCPDGVVALDLDDTLYKKSGRKVEGAGSFRDAVRSTRARVVLATGLNLVVVTLRVRPPGAGRRSGCPWAAASIARVGRPGASEPSPYSAEGHQLGDPSVDQLPHPVGYHRRDRALAHLARLEVGQELLALLLLGLLQPRTAGEDHVVAVAVELDDLDLGAHGHRPPGLNRRNGAIRPIQKGAQNTDLLSNNGGPTGANTPRRTFP